MPDVSTRPARLFTPIHVYRDRRGWVTAAPRPPEMARKLALRPFFRPVFQQLSRTELARRVCPQLAILVVSAVNNPACGLATLRGHRTHEISV